MHYRIKHIVLFMVAVYPMTLGLSGCFEPIKIDRKSTPDVWHEELSILPDEQIFAVSRNHRSIAPIIYEIEEANPNIQIIDTEELVGTTGPDTKGLKIPDMVTRLQGNGLSHLGVDIMIAVDTEGFGEGHFGIPPWSIGEKVVTLYAIVAPLDGVGPITRLNVRITSGGTTLLFPLPIGVATKDVLSRYERVRYILGREIGGYLSKHYKSMSLGVAIMWLSPEGVVRDRQYEGCTGTWDEIKKCAEHEK